MSFFLPSFQSGQKALQSLFSGTADSDNVYLHICALQLYLCVRFVI